MTEPLSWRWRFSVGFAVLLVALTIAACTSDGPNSTSDGPNSASDGVTGTTPTEPAHDDIAVGPPLVARLGDQTTVFDTTDRAFQASLRNMSIADANRFGASDDVFEKAFGPDEGLDLSLTANGCTSCHINNGRRDPTGGVNFQAVEFEGVALQYPAAIFGPTTADVRVAPAVIGMGLLEAIPAADIEALADPDDADGDGISGRVHYVVDPATGETVVGRFGWQASQATVLSQSSTAFETDLGILTPLLSGADAEISEETAELAAFYSEGLAVPARRNADDPANINGAAVFETIGCSSCHTPSFTTGDAELHALSGQEIWPYTDMLLHDMGPDMAGAVTFGGAAATEFRTAPLWGIGLHETVNGSTTFLHDGRARTLEEAIVWHGGEGAASRNAYLDLDADQKRQLLTFLENL
ncbi:MAG: hypothetical protein HKN26_14730 [Acidimicrobiales bacterium]|nr:hypothetical protein [Acidimicrobiales bacterium]